MQITLMRAKIHRATVTQADLNYEGSISIDENLLEKSGIFEHEMVDVLNINNGERFTTYAIKAKKNSGEIKINGAAARKVQIGDPVIIIAYGSLPLDQAKNFQPKILLLNNDNKIVNLKS
jgi:aspartate 1-decarboxylase